MARYSLTCTLVGPAFWVDCEMYLLTWGSNQMSSTRKMLMLLTFLILARHLHNVNLGRCRQRRYGGSFLFLLSSPWLSFGAFLRYGPSGRFLWDRSRGCRGANRGRNGGVGFALSRLRYRRRGERHLRMSRSRSHSVQKQHVIFLPFGRVYAFFRGHLGVPCGIHQRRFSLSTLLVRVL